MRTVDVRAITRLAALGVAAMIAAPAVVYAQAGQTISSQLDLRSSDAGKAMSAAMSTLATDPRNLAALLTAGESALTLEDPRSALGFFGRADDVSPNNGRVKAGLGLSLGTVFWVYLLRAGRTEAEATGALPADSAS